MAVLFDWLAHMPEMLTISSCELAFAGSSPPLAQTWGVTEDYISQKPPLPGRPSASDGRYYGDRLNS